MLKQWFLDYSVNGWQWDLTRWGERVLISKIRLKQSSSAETLRITTREEFLKTWRWSKMQKMDTVLQTLQKNKSALG